MTISIVIPNYNNARLLERNLPILLQAIKEQKEHIEIIVSDDASSDDSVTVVEKFFTSLTQKNRTGKLVTSKSRKDGGFSKNVNRGVKAATGKILVLLNTDVKPHKGFLSPLLTHFSDEKVFAVGCMDESIEDGKTILRGRGIGKWEKGFLFHSAGSLDKTNTLWVSGGSSAIRSSVWKKLGGLNELFNPFYWEDIDLSYRGQKIGYKVLFEKKSVVVHEHSEGPIKKFFKPYNVQKTVYRNQFIFVWVNITDKDLLLNHLLWLPYHLANAIKSADRAFLVGFASALLRLPKIYLYKRWMKKQFVKTDKEIIREYTS